MGKKRMAIAMLLKSKIFDIFMIILIIAYTILVFVALGLEEQLE
jgi:hypothetical protein